MASEETKPGAPNGEATVPEQYSALHQSQSAHDESLRQIREDLQAQRRAASEMQSALEGKIQQLSGANAGAASASELAALLNRIQELEGRLGRGGSQQGGGEGRLDAVLLRLSELERKMGEGTPDPLLNEIVHRLAAMENNPARNGGDHRVDEVINRISELNRKVEHAGPASDPRTDDLVLRIASMESATRRAVEAEQFESLDERLASIESQTRELSTQGDFERLRERLERLEAEALRAEDERFDQLQSRLSDVETRTSETPADPRVDEVQSRLESLEQKLDAPAADERVDEVIERLANLEDTVAQPPSDPRIVELADRMTTLDLKLVEVKSDQRLAEGLERLSALEQSSEAERASLRAQMIELEGRLEKATDASELDALRSRLAAIEAAAGEGAADPRVASLLERFTSLEEKLGSLEEKTEDPAADPRVAELASRVHDLELRPQESGADPRVEALLARIATLEESTSSADATADITSLRSRIAELEAAGGNVADPRVAELAARLAAVEERAGAAEDPEAGEKVLRVIDRLDALEEKLGEQAGQASSDPRVAELVARLEALEQNPPQGEADPRVDELLSRLNALEQQPKGGADVTELVARLNVLEKASGAGADARVDEVLDRLAAVEKSGGSAAPDKRVTEIIARLDGFEKAQKSGGSSAAGLEALNERIQALEAGGGGGSSEGLANVQAEFRSRYEDLQHRLQQIEAPSPAGEDVKSLIHKESERWTQWARNTLGEVGELRQRIEKLSEGGVISNGGSSQGGDVPLSEAMKTLGDTIAESLSRSVTNDVKALRSQMYFVFFTIGMLYALGAFFTYIAMSQGG
jgi:hypothetical protein